MSRLELNQLEQIENWFKSYGTDIHNYLVYYLGKSEVEDLVQDVFMKAMKGVFKYEGRSSPKTWLFTIARHVAHDYERKKRITNLLSLRLTKEHHTFEKTPEEILSVREELRSLFRLIKQLRHNYREVLLLRLVEGLTIAETAEVLEWTENKVNVTLHRALKVLRKEVSKEEGGIEIDGQ